MECLRLEAARRPASHDLAQLPDFNGDTLLPDVLDIADFMDIDFHNDGLTPDVHDVESLLAVFAGAECV